MRRYALLFFVLLVATALILVGTETWAATEVALRPDVIIFHIDNFGNYQDSTSYRQIAQELNLSSRIVGHQFINDKASFFDEDGQRKFKVLIFPGGEPYQWFEKKDSLGISCRGVDNIMKFIKSGGSVIAICICGPSIFATTMEWLSPNLDEAQHGLWDKTSRWPGAFKSYCGVYPFKGTLRGPQETNRPYPTVRFLPIKMNPENEIVQTAKLPLVIYQVVVGGGSIIPDRATPGCCGLVPERDSCHRHCTMWQRKDYHVQSAPQYYR